jgi:hypothetical protein
MHETVLAHDGVTDGEELMRRNRNSGLLSGGTHFLVDPASILLLRLPYLCDAVATLYGTADV